MKKTTALILFILMITRILSPVMADEGDVTVKTLIYNDRKSEITSFEAEFVWNEGWFDRSAENYNHALGTALCALSGTAYVDTKPDALINTLSDMGFDRDSIISSYITPTKEDNDTAGYVIARKELDDKDIIAIIVKGTSVDAEWYSNFNIGLDTDEHKGFLIASDKIWVSLEEFIGEHGISGNAKFVVAGHSRGAAVANIIAARLIDSRYGDTNNVYAYTFATPLVSTAAAEEGYESIFNIMASVDFVTRLPVSEWGFGRYGTDLFLPSKSFSGSGEYENMLNEVTEMYNSYTGKVYAPYEGSLAADSLSRSLFNKVDSRSDFYLREIYRSTSSRSTLHEYFTSLSGTLSGSGNISQSLSLLQDYKMEFSVVNNFFINNHIYSDKLFSAHSMASYFSWMQVCNESDLAKNGEFIRLKISGNVNIDIFDEGGELLSQIRENKITVNTLATNIFSGAKYVDIPTNANYSAMITPATDTSVNISVEVLEAAKTDIPVRAKDHYAVNLSSTDTLTVDIPSGNIIRNDAEEISATFDLSGDIPVYTVRIESVGNGMCYGGGKFRKGEYVTVNAKSATMEKFLGWYDGDSLISESAEYSFAVEDYTHIYAAFTENIKIVGDINKDKQVNSDDLSYILAAYGTGDTNCDFDNSGTVNALDLSVLLGNFGKSIE